MPDPTTVEEAPPASSSPPNPFGAAASVSLATLTHVDEAPEKSSAPPKGGVEPTAEPPRPTGAPAADPTPDPAQAQKSAEPTDLWKPYEGQLESDRLEEYRRKYPGGPASEEFIKAHTSLVSTLGEKGRELGSVSERLAALERQIQQTQQAPPPIRPTARQIKLVADRLRDRAEYADLDDEDLRAEATRLAAEALQQTESERQRQAEEQITLMRLSARENLEAQVRQAKVDGFPVEDTISFLEQITRTQAGLQPHQRAIDPDVNAWLSSLQQRFGDGVFSRIDTVFDLWKTERAQRTQQDLAPGEQERQTAASRRAQAVRTEEPAPPPVNGGNGALVVGGQALSPEVAAIARSLWDEEFVKVGHQYRGSTRDNPPQEWLAPLVPLFKTLASKRT